MRGAGLATSVTYRRCLWNVFNTTSSPISSCPGIGCRLVLRGYMDGFTPLRSCERPWLTITTTSRSRPRCLEAAQAVGECPWNGNFSGKANLPGFFKAVAQNLDIKVFDVQAMAASG